MRRSILIIDSEKANRESLLANLSDLDTDLVGTDNYFEGLSLLADRLFDIVIVDYSLSNEGAAIVCTVVQGRDDDTSLVITSSIQSRDIEIKARSYSPAFYMVKPYSVLDMKAVVGRILDWKNKVEQ